MSFTGKENHSISLIDASKLTLTFRKSNTVGARIGGFFGKDTIQEILGQPDCVGIRYYYGLDDDGEKVLVLVGVNADENDLYEGILAEIAKPCPPRCPTKNPLNS